MSFFLEELLIKWSKPKLKLRVFNTAKIIGSLLIDENSKKLVDTDGTIFNEWLNDDNRTKIEYSAWLIAANKRIEDFYISEYEKTNLDIKNLKSEINNFKEQKLNMELEIKNLQEELKNRETHVERNCQVNLNGTEHCRTYRRDDLERVHRTKIDLIQPFHGTCNENFENWFFIVDKFQSTNKIKDEDMLDVKAPLFRGNALIMLKRFEKLNGKGKYRDFMEKLKGITDKKVSSDYIRRKLDNLSQKENFETYLQKFMNLINQLDNMSDTEMLYRFESGLHTDTKNQLAVMKIDNFDKAVEVVTRFEANRRKNKEEINNVNYTKTKFPKVNRRFTYKNKTHTENDKNFANKKNHATNFQEKKEYQKKKWNTRKIKCYKCNKLGHIAINCKVKHVNFTEKEDSPEEEIENYSSLYVHEMINTIKNIKLMATTAKINGIPMKVALDSGATTSIMSARTARKYKFDTKPSRERIKTANNQISPVSGRINNIIVDIANHCCELDMLVFDHTDHDVLLGLDYCQNMNVGIFPAENMIRLIKIMK